MLFLAATASEEINYPELFKAMFSSFGVSLSIFFVTLIIALPLGLLLASGRMSRFRLIRTPIKALLTVVRGTPLMLQLFLFCYGPYYLFGFTGMIRELAAFIAFGINYACYFAEIYRGGIESVSIGQREAAEALGFKQKQTFFKIVLPQVIKNILPAMGNEFMTLVKDTSLARVIAVVELLSTADKFSNSYVSTIPLLISGAFYLAMNFLVGRAFATAEKKLNYYR